MPETASELSLSLVERLINRAFPKRAVSGLERLTGGRINTNLKVHFACDEPPVVLRLYRDGGEVCRKEAAILQLVSKTVPVPALLYSESNGIEGSPAFAILEFVDGISFRELQALGDESATRQAAYSVGKTLAAMGQYSFEKPGRLLAKPESRDLIVGEAYVTGKDPIPKIVRTFLDSPNVERRAGKEMVGRLYDFIWSWGPCLPNLEKDRNLVHSDFGNRNILVREEQGVWVVAAVLDWEFAFSGSPLLDVGHFLRYERCANPVREPWFSRGFVDHGGVLPDDWRNIARVIDLTALVECLTHDDLPADVEAELVGLIESTLDGRDPK